jgi:hypothetical protein
MYLVTVTDKEHRYSTVKYFNRHFKTIEKFFKTACANFGAFSPDPICEKTILAKESGMQHEITFEKLTSREVVELKKNEPYLFNN